MRPLDPQVTANRLDERSLHYRLRKRTWANPARVFLCNLLAPVHCELGPCELGALARNPLLARCWLLSGFLSPTAKAQRTQRETAWGNHDLAHLGPRDAYPHPYPRHRLGRWDPVHQTQTHATPKKAIHRATYHWAIHRSTRYQAGTGGGQCANSLDPDPRRSRGV